MAHLVLCWEIGCSWGGEVGDDLLASGISKNQILLQLAQVCEVLLLQSSIDAGGKLHMHIQPCQLLPAQQHCA